MSRCTVSVRSAPPGIYGKEPSPGHTYIQLTEYDDNGNVTDEHSYGLGPADEVKLDNVFEEYDGKIIKDKDMDEYEDSSTFVAEVEFDSDTFDLLQQTLEDIYNDNDNWPKYKIPQSDCTRWADNVLQDFLPSARDADRRKHPSMRPN